MVDILSMELDELQLFMKDAGESAFRAKQVYDWLHKKLVTDFDEMTNLSKSLREKLKEKCKIQTVEIVDKLVSKTDGTTKYLFVLDNDSIIESVLMRYSFGNAVCVSTQAGCRMGCTFCASTLN